MSVRVRHVLRARPYLFALVLALALLVANVIADPSFGAPSNWAEQMAALAPFAIVALASTPSILSGRGGLDLSIGPLTGLLNIVLVVWLLPHGLDGAVPDVLIVLAAGAAVGALNGLMVAGLRYQPVIATLCTLFVVGGLSEKIAAQPKSAPPNWTEHLSHGIGPAALMLAPALLWLALRRTPFLRTLYGVGGDDVTAYTSGIDVTRVRVAAYALGGLFAGVAAIAVTALLQTANASFGAEYTLVALAAVALGGTPIGGGRGGMLGSFFGAAVIYLLQTLLSSIHVSVTWLQVVYGVTLALGVLVGSALVKAPAGRRTA